MAGANIELETIVAFLDSNRAFGYKKGFPWPYLKGDHEFYINLSTTVKDPTKKNAYIMGRNSWEMWGDDEKCNPKLFTVVTSSSLKGEGVPYLQKVTPTLEEAIQYVGNPPVKDQIETIYIMGGKQNYDDVINDPRLKRIWITRIFAEMPADTFFPRYDHAFRRVPCPTINETMQEDNGIKYQFELWERFRD